MRGWPSSQGVSKTEAIKPNCCNREAHYQGNYKGVAVSSWGSIQGPRYPLAALLSYTRRSTVTLAATAEPMATSEHPASMDIEPAPGNTCTLTTAMQQIVTALSTADKELNDSSWLWGCLRTGLALAIREVDFSSDPPSPLRGWLKVVRNSKCKNMIRGADRDCYQKDAGRLSVDRNITWVLNPRNFKHEDGGKNILP
jgi:hypothetical protein